MSSVTPNPTRVLIVRPDRIGDVVLSTPVFEVLKRHYPRARITVMVREAVAPLIQGMSSVDEVMIYDPEGRHAGFRGLLTLISEIRKKQFKVAVVLQSQWRIAAAIFGAGVRYRVGPYSKVHSFFFYNRGMRQQRSHVEMHEADYNLQLLRKLGVRVGTRNVTPRVFLSDEKRKHAQSWLQEKGLGADQKLIVVHPGMGGSALNWPENHYYEYIRAVLRDGYAVVVTAGPTEAALLARFQKAFADAQQKPMFYGGAEAGGIDQLAGVLSCACLVLAPSTGPLHLATALKVPVVSFYPPIRVQSAIRWGPYVSDESQASILVPEVYCGEDFHCRGNLCNYFPCMKTITVTQALEISYRLISQNSHKIQGPESAQ